MDKNELRSLPGYSEKQVAEIGDIMSKDSLSFEWSADVGDEDANVVRIPDCVTSMINRETSERNRQLYTAFAMSQHNLLFTVEHQVHVHKDGLSKGTRQRKGGELKMYRRKLTLLDTASDFLIGLCYGDRNLFGWDFMRYNKHTLKALYSLAICMRHVIDVQLKECNVLTPRGCLATSNANAENNRSGDADVQSDMKKMYLDLLPNEQRQGRILSRCVWGVRASDYKNEHLGDGVSQIGEGEGGSPSQGMGTWGLDDNEDELCDDDDEEDELNDIVNRRSTGDRSMRENGSERLKERRTGDDGRGSPPRMRSRFEESEPEQSEDEERRRVEELESDMVEDDEEDDEEEYEDEEVEEEDDKYDEEEEDENYGDGM